MSEYSFIIPGEPRGKGRPRFATYGKIVRAYTPRETEKYEQKVRAAYKGPLFEGPVAVNMVAYYPIPASTSKKRAALMESGIMKPCKKPDADNVAKIVLDGLNGAAYIDDCQVVYLALEKKFGANPRIVVEIREIENESE